MRSAEFLKSASDKTIKGVKTELLPRFDAVASFGVINPGSAIHNSENYAVGLALTIPLYTGGQIEGRIDEEKHKYASTIEQEKMVAETIKLQVSRAWIDYESRVAQFKAALEEQTAASRSLSLASERYRLQLSTLVELTESETAASRANVAVVTARYEILQARSMLDWAVGEIVIERTSGAKR